MPDTIPDVRSLAQLCAQVIGVRTVAIEDNFIDAGGDSVSAARLAVLVAERWGVELDIFAVIAADSVREIHEGLAAGARDRSGQAT